MNYLIEKSKKSSTRVYGIEKTEVEKKDTLNLHSWQRGFWSVNVLCRFFDQKIK